MGSNSASAAPAPGGRTGLGAAARWLVLAALAALAACTTLSIGDPFAPAPAPAKPAAATRAAPEPQALAETPPPSHRAPPPTILPGNGILLAAQPAAPADGVAPGPNSDITFNFVDTDVREVLRAVLGGVLHLNYAVDSKVQATVTLQTSRPLSHDEVLPTLQVAMRASGLALVETAGTYRVVPLDAAARDGSAAVIVGKGPPQPRPQGGSYNVQIFPLRYVSADDMRQTIEPLLPKGAVAEVDRARNLLILSGSDQDLSTVTELLHTFDVDWVKGMSFGIYPLQYGTPRDIADTLNKIFGTGGSVPLAGVLRFAPLERMDAILAVSPQRAYLNEARAWIERLDRGSGANTPRLFEYHVQNSRASDLAKVLSGLFSSGQVNTVEAPSAPDKAFTAAENSANSFMNSNSATPGLGATPTGGTSPLPAPSATPSTPAAAPSAAPAPNAGTDTGRPQTPGLSQALGDAFGAGRGNETLPLPPVRIVADEKNNDLLIYARPRDYQMIDDALKRLDVVPLQVLIEATIAEVTLNDNLAYGTQWFFKKGGSNLTLTQATTGGTPPQVFPGFNYAFLAGGGANVVLSALSAVTDVNVVSSPQLLVLDHHVATLQVGDEVPVPTAQIQSTVTSGAPIVNTIQYLNTGVILNVSPRVNANGLITLDISQEVSDVGPTTSSTLNAPTINQRRVETSVTVLDGETVALGGLITENRSLSNSGVPILKDVPVLGSLFGTKQDNKQRQELLILLSPRVLHNAADARAVTDELRSRLHTIAPIVGRVH